MARKASATPVDAELEEHADVGTRRFRRLRAWPATRRGHARHLGSLCDQTAERQEVTNLLVTTVVALRPEGSVESERELAARPVENAALPPRDMLVAGAELAPEVTAERLVVTIVRERVAECSTDARRALKSVNSRQTVGCCQGFYHSDLFSTIFQPIDLGVPLDPSGF